MLVLDENGSLLNIAKASDAEPAGLEKHEGILCPGFVNAHCHLELSYLKNELPQQKGLIEFAKGIITKRMAFPEEVMKEAAKKADQGMWENGIVAVGDISNAPVSFDIKKESKINYHTFIELIGLNPQYADVIFNVGKDLLSQLKQKGLAGSLAPHAPYSVSLELMQKIRERAEQTNAPVSIHNQESREEDLFFKEKKGFTALYDFLKLPIDFFQATGLSSLRSCLPALKGKENVLLVHNTFTPTEDLKWANEESNSLFWCLCPNANLYIENSLPDLKAMLDADCRLCIGTDSLASNHSLSMTSEMNVLLKNYDFLTPAQILGWACSGGAGALGVSDRFGSFLTGKNAGLNLLSFENNSFRFQKKLA